MLLRRSLVCREGSGASVASWRDSQVDAAHSDQTKSSPAG